MWNSDFEGDVEDLADKFIKYLKNIDHSKPVILISGGETTVKIKGKGKGGRNQEFALHFLNEMKKRGVHASWRGDQEIQIDKTTRYQNEEVLIEGDATAATYAATLACIHEGTVTFKNLGDQSLQGDYQYFQILREMGATVSSTSGTTTVQGPKQFKKLATADMKNMPDAALTLIALAPLLQEELTISGLSSLHHKECDRLECSATELLKMGITAEKTHETITVQPTARNNIKEAILSTYHDHRMAMAFSLIGSATGGLTVDNKNVVDKTYPNFWADYQSLI